MSSIHEDQIAEFQDTFFLFDDKGDQKIHTSQIGEVLRAIGLNPTEAEVRKCGYSPEDDQRISFEQFLPVYTRINKNRDTSTVEDFVEGFRVFDKDQNGTITAAELRHLMTSLGEKLTEDECNELFQGHEDTQGNINYEDFIKTVLSG